MKKKSLKKSSFSTDKFHVIRAHSQDFFPFFYYVLCLLLLQVYQVSRTRTGSGYHSTANRILERTLHNIMRTDEKKRRICLDLYEKLDLSIHDSLLALVWWICVLLVRTRRIHVILDTQSQCRNSFKTKNANT